MTGWFVILSLHTVKMKRNAIPLKGEGFVRISCFLTGYGLTPDDG